MIRIAHASDTHECPAIVTAVADMECDVILLTGDILANKGRTRYLPSGEVLDKARISRIVEIQYQRNWFRKVAKKWAVAFRGRPVVYVPGNHDFVSIEPWLAHYGHTNIHTISDTQPFVDLCGKRFAGFREIPYIEGEWMGEVHDFTALVEKTLAVDPDILVTHAPPQGILDCEGYGIGGLTSALFYQTHKITHHFFGHTHGSCGVTTEGGITFVNSATTLRLVEVP